MKKRFSIISPYLVFFLLAGAVLVPAFFSSSLSGVAREVGTRIALSVWPEKVDSLIATRLASDTLGAHPYSTAKNECINDWECEDGWPGAGCRVARNTWCPIYAGWHVASHPECSDRQDNDGDGLTDYPADLGCTSGNDDDETNPSVECKDGRDNDGDGKVDLEERICSACGWGMINTAHEDFDGVLACPGGADPFAGPPPLVSLNLTVGQSRLEAPAGSPFLVDGNAYNTSVFLNWNVKNADSCVGSVAGDTSYDWWAGESLTSGSSNGVKTKTVAVYGAGDMAFSLRCHRANFASNAPAHITDTVYISPAWHPEINLCLDDDPDCTSQARASDNVYLTYSASDIKSCTRNWTPGTLTLSGGNPQEETGLFAGTISTDKTFTLTCTGFDEQIYQDSWIVTFLNDSPAPFFNINAINLIIVGPGSGGKSNKATISLSKSSSFRGDVTLTAASASLSSAGASLCFNTTGGETCSSSAIISCTTDASICDAPASFWVETASDIAEGVYDITLTATPTSGSQKTTTIPLRVRKFVPAFEEI